MYLYEKFQIPRPLLQSICTYKSLKKSQLFCFLRPKNFVQKIAICFIFQKKNVDIITKKSV